MRETRVKRRSELLVGLMSKMSGQYGYGGSMWGREQGNVHVGIETGRCYYTMPMQPIKILYFSSISLYQIPVTTLFLAFIYWWMIFFLFVFLFCNINYEDCRMFQWRWMRYVFNHLKVHPNLKWNTYSRVFDLMNIYLSNIITSNYLYFVTS